MTAQCAANGMWITMGAVRAMPGNPVEAAFSTVYGRVLVVCARAGAWPGHGWEASALGGRQNPNDVQARPAGV